MNTKHNSKLKNVLDFFKKAKNKIFVNSISTLRFITILSMLVKTILFLPLLYTNTVKQNIIFNTSIRFSFVYMGFILLIYSFGYLTSKNKQTIFYILINLFYSILLICDLWYFRTNKDLLSVKNIFFSDTFNPTGLSLINFKPIDLIFIVDFLFIIGWLLIKKIQNKSKRNIENFKFTLKTSIAMILISCLFFDALNLSSFGNSILFSQWSTSMSVQAPGPLGYHLVEASKSLSKAFTKANSDDTAAIEEWMSNNNENLPSNDLEGIFKGKNVFFIQLESFENFVLNKETNGKEITPFLNKLTKEGLYFNNIYQQNNGGNSIDCDFLVNTSIYPLGDRITAVNYGENTYPNSLPRLLNDEGYITISTHAEEHGEFNWTELHKNGFGSQILWSIDDYNYDEVVGYGLSDRSFYSQVADKLSKLDKSKPFFIQLPTLSSHGPFDINEKFRELNLPEEVDKSYLGGYFESVHYADAQIEMLFNKLKELNLFDNTVFVIYGDHAGVHKYYNDDIQNLDYEGGWWKEYDNKIPLIIYSSDMQGKSSIISAAGGQVDILPTISYLLGIDKSKYISTSMGRVLVNTNRDSTIIKGNVIKGNVQSESEKQHLLNAYSIGEKIITNNFWANYKK